MPGQNPAPTKHPRNENFFDMWKYTFCPNFKICSAIVFICMIQAIFFLAEIIHTAVEHKELEKHFFIGIQLQTLQKFGMRMPWLIRESGDVYRFFMPTFLHLGFSHFVINLIMQVALGTVVESVMGPLRFVFFYMTLSIGSNLFGACLSSQYAVGSDPVIYGMVGCLFTIVLMYWHRIGGTLCTKICMVMMVAVVFIISVLLMTQQAATAAKYA